MRNLKMMALFAALPLFGKATVPAQNLKSDVITIHQNDSFDGVYQIYTPAGPSSYFILLRNGKALKFRGNSVSDMQHEENFEELGNYAGYGNSITLTMQNIKTGKVLKNTYTNLGDGELSRDDNNGVVLKLVANL